MAVKSDEQHPSGLLSRTHDLPVRQRTPLIGKVRSHLTKHGWVAPKGPSHVALLSDLLQDEIDSCDSQDYVSPDARPYEALNARIGDLERRSDGEHATMRLHVGS